MHFLSLYINISKHKNYKNYYNNKLVEYVNMYNKDEIEYFNLKILN